jgi:16S rRNA (guanine527-N7)-methyltransferase
VSFLYSGIDVNREEEKILLAGAREIGVLLSREQIKQFSLYLNELLLWNQKMNLTSITKSVDIVTKHFLESLMLVRYIRGKHSLLDLGSGAGFPGIPVKIVMPDIGVILLDSREKKVFFQRHIIRMLGLKGIDAIHERADDMAQKEKYRESFDIVVSRAFASLEVIFRMGAPFIKKGGLLIVAKGKKGFEESDRVNDHAGLHLITKDMVKPCMSNRETVVLLYKKKTTS